MKTPHTYLILVPHGAFTQDWNLCTSLLLESLDCASLRSQELTDKIDLQEEVKWGGQYFVTIAEEKENNSKYNIY